MKKVQSDNPRILAVQTLSRVKEGAYSNLQLNQVIKKNELSLANRHLLTNLVYGVIQHRLTLAYWLQPFIAGKKLDNWVRELLYSALYQWQMLDKVPKHAVFNESIEVAKKLGHSGTTKFVTAILHQIDRQGLPDFKQIKDPVERLSVEYSVPTWLISELEESLGLDKVTAILQAINQAPHQSVRVNLKKATPREVRQLLTEEGYEVEASPVAAEGLVIKGKNSVVHSKAYKLGLITIQDESAMLPVEALQVNEQVKQALDVAAAPGGKTTQIAENLPADGQVLALDIHDHKLKLIEQNAERLGLSEQIQVKKLDARKIPETLTEKYDRILVDAPCSGLGLLRRKPEIRYEKSLADVESLAKLQLSILSAASQVLSQNGIMVYSTCTILPQENDQVVAQFLADNPDFEQIPVQTSKNLKADRTEAALHIYPDDYQTDGFFLAAFKHRE
ncbi:16S rRNA (cytosine(967)-C(5))-methyltransferase RsmB [Eupransor demetentiae]|uniref:16S rRNA (cytosine(967)-C(5))-methyltransferase n=1 Tax=Eupransor demetentiae TaxID=3109584 RepID=A0ABM9N4X9_9LACO|nr:Transcription antitermination protein NusB (NusB) [Lactobacillaceae bacterium LMG 33000]